ncbi:hypothetical protein DW028_14875 [Agathobacter rectalis]|uniref:Uncharacterized protein n=1 Tax=Agathobacter rectalis TaxID=39491 RepID=A0A415JMQ1_9FIRM|nr:hypothetical protein [Agathobacter rectalis]RHL25294.1 hypothetical protein DW028_14875 [Agathobacter rectalis]
MNIINELDWFFKGGRPYNIVSFTIGIFSLLFSVISFCSANKAKTKASDAVEKLDILESQLAYTNQLKNEYEKLLKSAQNYIGNNKDKIKMYISLLNRMKNSRACLLNRDEIEEAINNLNKLMKSSIITDDESAICIANGLVESFIESLGFTIVGEEVNEI